MHIEQRNYLLTLTTLSHPHDTITGFITLGLNRTQETLKFMSISHRYPLHRLYGIPLGVSIILNVVFALAEGVPEFDGFVART